MRRLILTAMVVVASAGTASAQSTSGSQTTVQSPTIIRTPPSSNGPSTGNSGSVGSSTPYYPAPLRDYNNPAATYGRFGPAVRVPRR